jgi:hypothetical protein
MKYVEILTSSAATISDRSNKYGTPDECFAAIAEITGAILGRKVSEHEVAAFQLGTKLGRARMNKEYADNYIDGASYLGFLGHFAMKDDAAQKIEDAGLLGVSMPSSVAAFAPKKTPRAISEDALRQAMDAVSAELDVVEK